MQRNLNQYTTADAYAKKWLEAIKQNQYSDNLLIEIIDKIYSDGFEDGHNQAESEKINQ